MSTPIETALLAAPIAVLYAVVLAGEDTLHRREVVELKGRLSAIEDALRSSPFVTFGRI